MERLRVKQEGYGKPTDRVYSQAKICIPSSCRQQSPASVPGIWSALWYQLQVHMVCMALIVLPATRLHVAGKSVGEFKPPKLRANDEDKLYVRRPVKEEEFRPPPAPSQKANNAPKPQPPKPL